MVGLSCLAGCPAQLPGLLPSPAAEGPCTPAPSPAQPGCLPRAPAITLQVAKDPGRGQRVSL